MKFQAKYLIGGIIILILIIAFIFLKTPKQQEIILPETIQNETKSLEYLTLCDLAGTEFIQKTLGSAEVYPKKTNLSCIYYNSPTASTAQAVLMIFATPYKTDEEAKKAFDLNKQGRCQINECINPLLGDDSIWTGAVKGGGMYVLQNNYYIKIEFPYSGDQYRTLDNAKKVASKIISLI